MMRQETELIHRCADVVVGRMDSVPYWLDLRFLLILCWTIQKTRNERDGNIAASRSKVRNLRQHTLQCTSPLNIYQCGFRRVTNDHRGHRHPISPAFINPFLVILLSLKQERTQGGSSVFGGYGLSREYLTHVGLDSLSHLLSAYRSQIA